MYAVLEHNVYEGENPVAQALIFRSESVELVVHFGSGVQIRWCLSPKIQYFTGSR